MRLVGQLAVQHQLGMLPVPLNSWKMMSSILLPVSMSAVADDRERATFLDIAAGRPE